MSTATASTAADKTLAEQLHASPRLRQAVDAIVEELVEKQQGLTGVRGPVSEQHRTRFRDMLDQFGKTRALPFSRPYMGSGVGNGPLVELIDGSVKYDMISGIGVHFFGHSDPDLVRAAVIAAATNDIAMQGHFQGNEEPYRFSEALLGVAKKTSRLAHVFLSNSGAMANENALKICMQRTGGAPRVIAFQDAFLGRTITMAQIGDSAGNRVGIPLSAMVDYMPFYDEARAREMSSGDVSGRTRIIDQAVRQLEAFIKRYPRQHSCFEMELIQGEGGFNTAPPEFFKALMQVCRDHKIPVWVDEVQTFGRTTQMFCFETLGLGEYVDVCSVGKLPQLCATLFTEDMAPKPGLIAGTFLGSSMSAAVGRQTIERLRDGDYYGDSGRNARHHRLFTDCVRALAAKHPDWFPAAPGVPDIVGGIGGMMRFTPFGGKKDAIFKLLEVAYDEGVMMLYCGHDPFHIRMLPPLGVLKESAWPEVFAIIERALARTSQELAKA